MDRNEGIWVIGEPTRRIDKLAIDRLSSNKTRIRQNWTVLAALLIISITICFFGGVVLHPLLGRLIGLYGSLTGMFVLIVTLVIIKDANDSALSWRLDKLAYRWLGREKLRDRIARPGRSPVLEVITSTDFPYGQSSCLKSNGSLLKHEIDQSLTNPIIANCLKMIEVLDQSDTPEDQRRVELLRKEIDRELQPLRDKLKTNTDKQACKLEQARNFADAVTHHKLGS